MLPVCILLKCVILINCELGIAVAIQTSQWRELLLNFSIGEVIIRKDWKISCGLFNT